MQTPQRGVNQGPPMGDQESFSKTKKQVDPIRA